LYQILEVTFHPLTICSAISPVFKQLSEDPSYAPYLPLLHRVLLSRLFSQLSTVYSSVKISHVLELVAPLETPVEPSENKQSYNQERIEAFIMGCAKRGELQIRVDHAEGSITFTSEVFGSSVASSATEVDGLPQSSNLDIVRTRLSRLAESLSVSLSQLYPQASAPSPTDEFRVLVKAAEEERKRLALHRTLTSRRAELLSELRVRKEKEEQSRIAEATRREKEEEGKRMVESVRKREQEKIQRELESVKKKEAETILINLKAKGGLKVDIEVSPVASHQMSPGRVLSYLLP
jgi:translation initiation factor 3 subunit A